MVDSILMCLYSALPDFENIIIIFKNTGLISSVPVDNIIPILERKSLQLREAKNYH